jgi:hypothetical protein
MSATIRRNQSVIADRVNLTGDRKKELQEKLKQTQEEESKLVKGIFKNLECPGGSLRFYFRKYKEDPVKEYVFWDGREYEIPLGVARHLNNNCAYPTHAHAVDEFGTPKETVGKMNHRFAFISKDFH